jgi:hypothetical protein
MFSQKKNIKINIEATDYVDFNEIDARIKHNGEWAHSYPMQAEISCPLVNEKEIVDKLKKDDRITCIDGILTLKGEEVSNELAEQFNMN